MNATDLRCRHCGLKIAEAHAIDGELYWYHPFLVDELDDGSIEWSVECADGENDAEPSADAQHAGERGAEDAD